MWDRIIAEFSDMPSQLMVARALLENGFGITEDAKVHCNGFEIPATQIGRMVGVDRRVVDSTTHHILDSPNIRDIFLNMRATPDLSRVAGIMDLSVITLLPTDAKQKGIVGDAVKILVEHELTIRQIFVTDPMLSEEPRLVMIIEDRVPGDVYEELRSLPRVKQLII